MAETAQQKTPSLAEAWSLQDKEKSDHAEVSSKKTTGDEKPVDATSEEAVPEKTDETPVTDETNPVAEENSETSEQEGTESTPEQEGTEPTPVQEGTESQEVTAEEPVIKLETAPADFRFPTTNQTRHCFTRYIEYHKCIAAKGEGASECEKFAKYYRSLCPSEWIERWDEQRANGTFPGPL